MPGNIGWQGAIIILIVLLVVFGPKRLPEMGRSLGRGMREFKDPVTGHKLDDDDDEQQVELTPTSTEAPATTPAAPPVQSETERVSSYGTADESTAAPPRARRARHAGRAPRRAPHPPRHLARLPRSRLRRHVRVSPHHHPLAQPAAERSQADHARSGGAVPDLGDRGAVR